MTEKRIKELVDWLRDESGLSVIIFDEDEKIITDFIRIVATEACKEVKKAKK